MAVKPLNTGSMRHRVTIQSRVIARSAQGGFSYSWNNIRSVWSKVSPVMGNEYIFSTETRAKMTHSITMRAQSETITPDMRITFGTRVFNIIEAKLIDEIKHELQIAAIENVGVVQDSTGENMITTFQTDEFDFTTTQDVTKSMPLNKLIYLDGAEFVCTSFSGVVVTQPTFRVGIAGSLTKYLSRITTQLTGLNKRQAFTGLAANDGESALRLGISVAGAVSAGGTYRGIIIVKGVLVG